ncbi:MAG: cobalt-precorrin-5B (C(1))-methyltransferase [Hyphomicrobiaceae bacterium]
MDSKSKKDTLRRGWTTGTCATAATRAAIQALWTGEFPDPVTVTLPKGQRVAFSLAKVELGDGFARVGIIKDAGDDPDVTHGALVEVMLRAGADGSGITFHAGEGVGTVTKPGLPLPPGEPAINPVPRDMMRTTIAEAAEALAWQKPTDIEIEVSIPGGKELAAKTLNGRLGVIGGLSVLGTTGIVIPFSCAAWIDSIHRGIDIARATGLTHIAGSTGTTSEEAIAKLDGLDDSALIEMGDFVGGMLKYLKTHPVARLTIAGGIAKMIKLGQGRLDLHSKRGAIDFEVLAAWMQQVGAPPDVVDKARNANTALEVFQMAESIGVDLGQLIATKANAAVRDALGASKIDIDVAVFDRHGRLVARV